VRLQPNFAEAWNNLGLTLKQQGDLDEPIRCYREALRYQPAYLAAHMNLGNALRQQALLVEAADRYREALRLKPDFAEAYSALGVVFQELGSFDESMDCYEQALTFKQDLAEAHWNRGVLRLLLGDLEQAWPDYEWRWTQTRATRRVFSQPLWDGSDLQGGIILLYTEQGRGDTLQFIRYMPLLKQRGAKVVVECNKSLMPLLARVRGIDELLASDSALAAFDVHVAVGSLPGIFHTSLATIPKVVPYLQADALLVRQWQQELRESRKAEVESRAPAFSIGICWQGDTAYGADRQRSIPLIHFARLAQMDGIRLISLQKGLGTEQLKPGQPANLLDLTGRLDESSGAFMDTAAIMANLDLVITSDTAIAHLAGALAVPVWVALPHIPDWRWLLERVDSPWYPTMRLFRQSRAGDWDEVFERIAEELRSAQRRGNAGPGGGMSSERQPATSRMALPPDSPS
jgi:hypothetical protein